jgi:hypothetical protein
MMKHIAVLAVTALAACGSPNSEQPMSASKEKPMPTAVKPAPRTDIPPLDATVPTNLETATFATG